jgi:ADP-ribose pyrophosphatase YjhB (NUDIX family)
LYANKFIPKEYRKIAEKLFPPGGFPPGKGPDKAAARAFAEILGIGADYKRLLSVNKTSGEMRHFLAHFQNNLELLIQKTWIEKADEDRKAKLETRLPPLVREIEEGNFQKALRDFGVILEELAYLFFGAQSSREACIDSALRIAIQMGLVWWYGGRLGCLASGESAGDESLWAVLLLGICYLTNF